MSLKSEAELYQPIKDFLEFEGYAVQGEVVGCDVVAVRGEDILVVEMKRQFNLKLVMQAIARQQVCSSVYMAFPSTVQLSARRRMSEIKALAKRLHLGIILVHDRPSGLTVEVLLTPDFKEFRINVKAQKAFMKELMGREHSVNTGGVTKTKIVTVHKERALSIAAFLKVCGPQSIDGIANYIKQTKQQVGKDLRLNHYGWYLRVNRGVYSFNEELEGEFRKFGTLVEFYEKRAKDYSQLANQDK